MRWCVNRWHGGTIGRHSLSHALAGVPAPSEREPGRGAYHSSGYSLMSGVSGDFHRPYGTQRWVHFTIHRGTLPQAALAGCRLPQRGSREWLVPFNRVLAEIRGCGRFSSPLRKLRGFLHFTIQRGAFPQEGSRGGCKLGGLGGAYPSLRAINQRDIPKRASCSGPGDGRN